MSKHANPWKVIGQKPVYDNPWISLVEYNVINPSGNKGIYGKVHFKNTAIGIVALNSQHEMYLVGQYRFVLDEYSWEIPEGGCPDGEAFLSAAQRELLEETGLVADHWTELFRMHLSNSVSDELAVIYMAMGLEQRAPQPEDTEDLQVRKLPFSQVVEMVKSGSITDAITIAAIQHLQLKWLHDPHVLNMDNG